MFAATGSMLFSWLFKLGTFIMVNVLDALGDILRGNYRLIICY